MLKYSLQGLDDIMVKRVKRRPSPKLKGLAALPRRRGDDYWATHELVQMPAGKNARPPARPFRVGGGPLQDPADLRSERYAMRMHPDLRDEMTRLARMQGWKMSQWIE